MLFHNSNSWARQNPIPASIQSDLADTKKNSQKLSSRSDELQRQVDFLAMANQALFELVSAKLGITEGDVLERMKEIDGRDGKVDGKMAGITTLCPQCGRIANTAKNNCIYCGALIDTGHLFQKGR